MTPMTDAAVFATFIIVFRETLEAGLIVGIILTVLDRLGALRHARHVWSGAAAAIAASIVAWGVLAGATQSAQGWWEQIIEGLISLAACGVLAYMVVWMDRQAKQIRPHIEHEVEAAVSQRALLAMFMLSFVAVFREGAETALFLQAVAIQNSGLVSLGGGLLGGGLALCVTTLIFVGGRKVPLRPLFRCTGFVLLLMAAGLLAYGIHELHELGWIPPVIDPVWNTNHLLNEKEGVGSFLKALFGYNGNPSLVEVTAYGVYLVTVMTLLRRSSSKPAAQ